MPSDPFINVLCRPHIICSIYKALDYINVIGHNALLRLERLPVNRKAHLEQDGLFKFRGGDDGT